MLETIEKEILYPIRKIWKDIAKAHDISLRHFTQEYFLPETQKDSFPYLANLAQNLARESDLGIKVAEEADVFEGSNYKVSLAYFGRKIEGDPSHFKENGLIYIAGRRIRVRLSESGNGILKIEDKLVKAARNKLGKDSLGSSHDIHPRGEYCFKQRKEDPTLPGFRSFLEHLLSG